MMTEANSVQCSCGLNTVEIIAAPLFGAYCHCTLCQDYNQAPYACVAVYKASAVLPIDESHIHFKAYKKPELVQRGRCSKCSHPVMEKVAVPLMPKLTIIPSSMFADKSALPSPSMHIFYDKRIADVNDQVKKYSGFMASQMAFSSKLIRSLL